MTTQVSAGEITLAVEERGAGDPILLVAGGFMDMDQWDAQMAAFSDGHRVIRYDPRGVGQSTMTPGGYTIEQFAADAAALIAALAIAPCVVWGNSVGALAAIELALTAPRKVRALVLAAATAGVKGVPTAPETQQAFFRGAALPMEQAAAALQDILFSTDYHDQHPELLETAIAKRREYPPPTLATMGPLQAALTYDPLERLGALRMPTLIVHGEEDRVAPADNARILGEAIPESTVVLVPRAGHAVVVEGAAAVNAAVGEFLAGL